MPGDIPTFDDFFQVARQEWRLRNPSISVAEIDREGSDSNIQVAVAASMASEATRYMVLLYQSLLLDSAKGKDLDRLVADRYNLLRNPAAPSVVDVTFSRSAITGGPGSIPVGTKLATTDGKQFLTIEIADFGAADLSVSGVGTESVLAGRATKISANQLTKILDTVFDTTITVANPSESAGGADEESDENFRERARDFFPSARRGTLAAIEFGARTVAGVKWTTALDVLDPDGLPAEAVDLYIADGDDTYNVTLITNVKNALVFWRAGGILVNVKGGVISFQAIQMTLQFEAGRDSVQLAADVRAGILLHVNALKIGETLYEADLLRLARTVRGVIVNSTAVVVPVGDVVPQAGQFIRTRADLVTFS